MTAGEDGLGGFGRFDGAKLALVIGDRLAVIERDDVPHIPWPGRLDLPGGGREGGESAEACVRRELQEELGLVLPPGVLGWRRFYPAPVRAWFFAVRVPAEVARDVVFGGEGAGWRLMPPAEYVAHPRAVPHLAARVGAWLAA